MRFNKRLFVLVLAALALLSACATTPLPPGARTVEVNAPGSG